MKAVCRYTYGHAEVIEISEIDIPGPGDKDILIKVHATTISRTDCAILTASPFIMRFITGLTRPKNPVLGTDFAGEVVETGAGVTRFRQGDRVWGFNDMGISSQAEYMCIPEASWVAHVPDRVDYPTAAAGIEGAHYARNFLNKVDIREGQHVMVNGGSGAIGSAMIAMLNARGARVTATCREEHIEEIRKMGADRLINYEKEDFTRDQEQYDFVFDAVGKSTFGKCRRLLKKQGVYISSELGPYVQNPFLALVTPLGSGKKVGFPFPHSAGESLKYSGELISGGAFTPLIDKSYAIEQAAEAYAYVLSGQKKGNVLLKL